MAFIRDILGSYHDTHGHLFTESDILQAAEDIIRTRFERQGYLTHPDQARSLMRARLAHLRHEEFHAIWLDMRHQLLGIERLSVGTLDAASVYPREIVKAALRHNASAVIFAHNHPSGVAEESQADRNITSELQQALRLVGVRLLDHLIVGATEVGSFAQRGLL